MSFTEWAMGLEHLLDRLEREAGTSGTAARTAAVPHNALISLNGTVGTPGTAQIENREGERTSRWWPLRFADREHLQAATCPPATHAEILQHYPSAFAAEPGTASGSQPLAPLLAGEERAVLTWLARIGETDPATIAEVLVACRRDIQARRYFVERAEWRPTDRTIAGCASCRHSRRPGGVVLCCGADRPDLPLAYGVGHPLRRLPDDQGHCCNQHSELGQKGVE